MCGLAGIFFKKADTNHVLGRALVEMLDGCQHRGPDSTGFALYDDNASGLRLRFLVEPAMKWRHRVSVKRSRRKAR